MAGIEMQILDMVQMLRNPIMDQIMLMITRLGDGGILWILFALLLFVKKDTGKIGILIFLAILLEVIFCNVLLKPMFQRIRPCDLNDTISLLIDHPDDYSFPSGHTGAAFAFSSSLFFTKQRFRYQSLLLSILIAFSRMYLYVHYPTDILGGIILGIMCGYLSYQILQAFNKDSHKIFLTGDIIK